MRNGLALVSAILMLLGCSAAPDEVPPSPPGDSSALGLEGEDAGRERGRSITSSNLPPGVVPGSQEDLEITVGDRVFFDYDSAVLSQDAATILEGQAAWLEQYPNLSVTIEGHADERGTREYNLALADRRAIAVRNYLIALDVAPNRIATISFGEERPAMPGNTEEAFAANRRAVTVVNVVN